MGLFDLKHILRQLLRHRAFTLVALLSIGLGSGANSAIFSLVHQALYPLLPVNDPERLVLTTWKGNFMGKGWGSGNLQSYPFYKDLKAENQVFDGVFGRDPIEVHVSLGGASEPVG